MILALFLITQSYAIESVFTRAERMSCEMVKQTPNLAQMHWTDRLDLRRQYFKAIYDEFELSKLTPADDLYQALAPCDF